MGKGQGTRDKGQLSHVDASGRIKMVDVGQKPITERAAIASGFVHMSSGTLDAIKTHQTPKGDPLETARLAGIMAAKRAAELIPLCHPLMLTHVDVQLELQETGVAITAQVSASAQTGVEMEALTAVSMAALTLYDMCKAVDKGMIISDIRLEKKTGGRSGDYHRSADLGS
jgi:cyclic pyranopterin phosphate synthase